MLNAEEREIKFKDLEEEILNCKKCPLYKTRTNPVIGEGSMDTKIIFVGEAPGFNEDQKGQPFCGAAGKVLDELLNFAGVKREEIYITNILKCRPPQNRNPKKEEIESCTPYLEKQIEILRPKVICALGNYSTTFLMEKYGLKDQIQGISKIHGKVFSSNTLFGSINIIPLYHPAVVAYNINMKEVLKKDFKILQKFL